MAARDPAMPLLKLAGFSSLATMRVCDSLTAPLADEFGVTTTAAAHTISVFAIAYGVMQLVYGPLSERIGRVRLVGSLCAVLAVVQLALLFVPSLSALLVMRALSGACAAGIVPICMAYIGDTVAYERRQPELAGFMSATLMGTICGQWLGGVVGEYWHWRVPFALLALGFAGAAILLWRGGLLRAPARSPSPVSAVIDGAAGPSAELSRGPSAGPTAFIDQIRDVFRNPWSRRIYVLVLLEGAFAMSIFALVPTHLHERYGMSMAVAGGLLALVGVGGLTYTLSARRLLARLGERGLARAGGLGLALCFGLLAGQWGSWWAGPACLLGGLGLYMLHNTFQTHATQLSPRFRGTAVSLFASCLFLGQSFGVWLAATLVGEHLDRLLFTVAALASLVLGLTFSAMIGRRASSSPVDR